LDVCTCTHMLGTCLRVWAVRYCSLSCFFSPSSSSNHNQSLSLVLVLFSFSLLFFFLPPSFPFCSTSAHLLHLLSRSSLLQNGAVLRWSWSCRVHRRERERRPSNLCLLVLLLHRVWIDFVVYVLFSECFSELRFHALFQALPECGGYSESVPTSLLFLYKLHSSAFKETLYSYPHYTYCKLKG